MSALPRVGTAPVNWNNDDLCDWAPEVPFPAILDEMVAAGYAGTELGSNFPPEPAPLRAALAARGLALAGAYQWLPLLDADALAAALPALDRRLALLAELGCQSLNVACSAGAAAPAEMPPARVALAGRVPLDGSAGLADAQWRTLGDHLAAVARRAAGRGVRTHYHNHAGSWVETPAEVERLLASVDPALVDLCFDAGHYAYGGGDPAAFVARHAARIGYVHLKDVDPAALARARAAGLSFLDALRAYVFCELGQGVVDVPAVVAGLRAAGFAGWIVVEQDTTPHPPTASARRSRDYLRQRCGL